MSVTIDWDSSRTVIADGAMRVPLSEAPDAEWTRDFENFAIGDTAGLLSLRIDNVAVIGDEIIGRGVYFTAEAALRENLDRVAEKANAAAAQRRE